jgi:hypothetical protein
MACGEHDTVAFQASESNFETQGWKLALPIGPATMFPLFLTVARRLTGLWWRMLAELHTSSSLHMATALRSSCLEHLQNNNYSKVTFPNSANHSVSFRKQFQSWQKSASLPASSP